ncbi:unnamed protein product [Bursaphelenchus xylophilus]|uniref:(pine wood nematode) hypothetical protein n=1 Tax=Bursaphelenchus xylophilus TaxID=6326 RepID=A0A7I8XN27_BURXY|nr:unnamed protein product [Bursaphelenchus xylophilus]CAG9089564.1 unnamed protein product [Bursaphelenchus xylophilus]
MKTTPLADRRWHHYHILFEAVISVVSFSLNGIVLLVATRNHKQAKTAMNSYSTLVVCTTLTDLAFTLVNLITMEEPGFGAGGLFKFCTEPRAGAANLASAPALGANKGSHFFRRRTLERDLVGFKPEASAIIQQISKGVYGAPRPRKSTAKFSRNERIASSKETAYFICSGGRVVSALAFCARRREFDFGRLRMHFFWPLNQIERCR